MLRGYANQTRAVQVFFWTVLEVILETRTQFEVVCVFLFLTSSALLRTRSRLSPRAAFTSSSVHPLLSSSATTLGTLDTSSRPSGSLKKIFYFLELTVNFNIKSLIKFFLSFTVSVWLSRIVTRSFCLSQRLNVLYSPCNPVVISTKTYDGRPRHFLYMVKVVYDESR